MKDQPMVWVIFWRTLDGFSRVDVFSDREEAIRFQREKNAVADKAMKAKRYRATSHGFKGLDA